MNSAAYRHLEAGDAAKRALRRTYLCRIVRKGGHLVADAGGYIGKDVAGKLHAVATVAGKTHDDLVEDFDVGFV